MLKCEQLRYRFRTPDKSVHLVLGRLKHLLGLGGGPFVHSSVLRACTAPGAPSSMIPCPHSAHSLARLPSAEEAVRQRIQNPGDPRDHAKGRTSCEHRDHKPQKSHGTPKVAGSPPMLEEPRKGSPLQAAEGVGPC